MSKKPRPDTIQMVVPVRVVVPPAGAALCYIEEPFAYFTTLSLEEQWGDDWNDAPTEHNSGPPYVPHESQFSEGIYWEVYRIAYEAPYLALPYHRAPEDLPPLEDTRRIDSGTAPGCAREGLPDPRHPYFEPDPTHFSVREINAGVTPWLWGWSPLVEEEDKELCIWAGEGFEEFSRKVALASGEVLVPYDTERPYGPVL